MSGRHYRRRRLVWPAGTAGAAGGASMVVLGVLLSSAAGAVPLEDRLPLPAHAPEVQIGTAIQVTRDDPVPHPPSVVAPPPRPVAKVASPCSAKRTQLKAVEVELVTVYRTPSALELAEDAGTIARALFEQCGREGR